MAATEKQFKNKVLERRHKKAQKKARKRVKEQSVAIASQLNKKKSDIEKRIREQGKHSFIIESCYRKTEDCKIYNITYDPTFKAIQSAFDSAINEYEMNALYRIFKILERKSILDCLRDEAVDDSLPGFDVENQHIIGLKTLASLHRDWIREPETWSCKSKDPWLQFKSLAKHLLTEYKVPEFLYKAFFGSCAMYRDKHREIDWFIKIGQGHNIRKSKTPIHMTKKMAHAFLSAPDSLTPYEAIRWCQVVGLGGSPRLAHAIAQSRLGSHFENEEFWSTVIHWFVNCGMFNLEVIDPVIDYIRNQKYCIPGAYYENGIRIIPDAPPQPNLSMKGRTLDATIRQMEEWHTQTSMLKSQRQQNWGRSTIEPLENYQEGDGANLKNWEIVELTTAKALSEEGLAMRHCVATYASSCVAGHEAIFSMRCNGKRIATISVELRTKRITEARGKFNAKLEHHAKRILKMWATQGNLKITKWVIS